MEFIKTNDENSLCSKAAVLFMNCIMTNPIMTQQVASFLTPFEAEDMRRVSQGWRKMINPVLFVHKIKCHKWVQPGPSNDHEMPFFFDVLESSLLTKGETLHLTMIQDQSRGKIPAQLGKYN